jgi:hypothetical protein
MKKVRTQGTLPITLLTTALLVICFAPILETSGSITITANLTTTGTMNLASYSTINKGIYAYGSSFSDADTTFIANHFNILNVDFGTNGVANIKAKNPNIQIIGYKDLLAMHTTYSDWSVVNSHEDWFIHDASGNRIKNPSWGWYLMDVGNAGWRAHWISDLNSKLGTTYDGVFIDDVWNALNGHGMSGITSSQIARWHSDTLGMLQYIKANIAPGKLVIINTDEWNSNTYVSAVDGEMLEGFTHEGWTATYSQGGRDPGLIMVMINKLAGDSAAGKIVWSASGSLINSDSNEMARMVKYCYASFLLGANGPGAYWGFNTWVSGDGSNGYYSIMDTPIGSATGSYYQSQNVYMRDFTNAKALFNPSAYAYTINLGGTYKTLTGTTLTSITISPYSGEILLKT